MLSKAERTTLYILEKVAPVFNKNGYVGTSMAALEKATGLTRGAIYGNFDNKETLALEVFNYTIRRLMKPLNEKIKAEPSASGKLKAVTNFYRYYYDQYGTDFGGCPILNAGINYQYQNELLFERTQEVVGKLKQSISRMIQQGIDEGEFKSDLNADLLGARVYGMLQGGIFLAMNLKKNPYLIDMLDHIDQMVETEMKR